MKLKIILLWTIFISLSLAGQTNEEVIFTDSLTSAKIIFPSNTKLEEISYISFKKCVAVLDNSDIIVYSMKNTNKEQYSWTRINEFDKESKYGKIIRSVKVQNKTEGWHRYYQNRTKKGLDYVTCVTLIRGNEYALYMVESAYEEEDLKSEEVTASSIFPGVKVKIKKRTGRFSEVNWAIIMIITLSAFCFWSVKKNISNKVKIILIFISTLLITVYLLCFTKFAIIPSIILMIINGSLWYACLFSESWSEFWSWIDIIIKNINN